MKKNVFITGMAGCVGHYLFDLVKDNGDYHFYMLVRSPKKILFDYSSRANFTVIEDDLVNIDKHADLLKQMDIVIHIVADWGGVDGNYDLTIKMLGHLD